MSLPVVLSAAAHRDLQEICAWWSENRSAEQAERWFDCAEEALQTLPQKAGQCSLAAESPELPFAVKQFNFGVGGNLTHRLVFVERPDCVYVFRVRHLAQDELTIDGIGDD